MSENNEKQDKKATVSLQANGFPISAFREWTEACEKDFGGCRWVKMMYDHKSSKLLPLLQSMASKIEELEINIQELTIQPKQKEDTTEEKEVVVKTLGGKKNE